VESAAVAVVRALAPDPLSLAPPPLPLLYNGVTMKADLALRRALIIGGMGPSVFLLGLTWTVLRLTLGDPSLAFRDVIFAPSHQMMLVGAIVSAICTPVALAVRRATPEELALPGFEATLHAGPPQPSPDGGERPPRRRSYQRL